jgi:hypothetical protein
LQSEEKLRTYIKLIIEEKKCGSGGAERRDTGSNVHVSGDLPKVHGLLCHNVSDNKISLKQNQVI